MLTAYAKMAPKAASPPERIERVFAIHRVAAHGISFCSSPRQCGLYQPSATSFARSSRKAYEDSTGAGTSTGGALLLGSRLIMPMPLSEWKPYMTSVASAFLYASIQCAPAGCAMRQLVRSYHSSSILTWSRSFVTCCLSVVGSSGDVATARRCARATLAGLRAVRGPPRRPAELTVIAHMRRVEARSSATFSSMRHTGGYLNTYIWTLTQIDR